jgi:hypothetical protein
VRSPGVSREAASKGAVVEIAERVIGSGHPELAHFGIDDSEAWGVGLPCGGEIDVWVQAYEPGPFEDAARDGARAAEVTMLAGPQAGARLVITPDGGRFGSLGSADWVHDTDAYTPRRHDLLLPSPDRHLRNTPSRGARRSASADSPSNGSDRLSARGDSGANGRGGTVSVGPASRPRRNRNRKRSRKVRSNLQRPSRPGAGGHAPAPTRTPGTPAAIDEQVWERTMNRLRRLILLLSVALAAVIARMAIDGPKLLRDLTGALIVVLLLCSLALRRQGVRLQPGASSETERVDAR